MKKLLCMLCLAACVLCGCSSNKTETLKCTGTLSGVINVTNTIEYEDDKVLKQTLVNVVTVEDLGISESDLETLVSQYSGSYDIDGVTYSYKIEEGVFTETIAIDFEKANFDDLATAGLISAEEEGTITYISLEETKEALETASFVCE